MAYLSLTIMCDCGRPGMALLGNLRGKHLVWGEPINPFGQVHTALWLTTLQMALGAQGLSCAHGLMHCLFLQFV